MLLEGPEEFDEAAAVRHGEAGGSAGWVPKWTRNLGSADLRVGRGGSRDELVGIGSVVASVRWCRASSAAAFAWCRGFSVWRGGRSVGLVASRPTPAWRPLRWSGMEMAPMTMALFTGNFTKFFTFSVTSNL